MGAKTDQEILEYTKHISTISIIEYVCGLTFLLLNIWLPFTKTTKQLPHYAWFPFDWAKSPAYELIYFMHSYFTGYLNCPVVVGCDILYYGICANCVAQFRLLCQAIRSLGTDDEEEVTQKLVKLIGVDTDNAKCGKEESLLRICIKYHQKLIRFTFLFLNHLILRLDLINLNFDVKDIFFSVCEDVNRAFGSGYISQLLASAIGICMPCYRLSNAS